MWTEEDLIALLSESLPYLRDYTAFAPPADKENVRRLADEIARVTA